MIKGKGGIKKVDGVLYQAELTSALAKLPDNQDFSFVIVDKKKNRNMPNLTYLFSVVLPQISEQLPDHPSTKCLYRYFEKMFAPRHTETVGGEVYEYSDLKYEKILIVDEVVEKIINYAQQEWGITIMSREDLKDAENAEFYSQAYLEQNVSWAKFLSHQKDKNSKR